MSLAHLLRLMQEAHGLQQADVASLWVEKKVSVREHDHLASLPMLHGSDLEDGGHFRQHPLDEVRPLRRDLAEDAPEGHLCAEDAAEKVILFLQYLEC